MSRSNAQPVGTVRTQRNRKVSCAADGAESCGFAVYLSRKQLVRAGVWPCPCCGAADMLPVDADDAALVLDGEQLAAHPGVVEYDAARSSAMHGQAGPARALRNLGRDYSPDAAAVARVESDRRARARERRLGALRRGSAESLAAALAAAEPMPF